ncbi:MAG: arylesterase [Hyphomicrobiales bacterium]|nr:arylesterase [Hyphomicrobiales bacterium]
MNYNSAAREKTVRFGEEVVIAICILFLSIFTPAVAKENTIVVLGDSLTAGYGLEPGEAFPEQLAKMLKTRGIDINIINAGVSGDTTAGGLARLDWSVQNGTDAVIVELGANDALRGILPAQTTKNLETIIQKLENSEVQVLLVGMRSPPNMGQKYVDDFDAIYPKLAEKYDLLFYPFFLEGVAANPDLNQGDGIHPTAEGIMMIASQFLPTAINLIELLDKNDK